MTFIKNVLIHMRPYLLFVSGLGGLVGTSLYKEEVVWINFFLLSFCFYLGYGFGQALTDCFQIDTDRISSPYRPLSKGDITPKKLLIVSIIGLSIIAFVLIYFNFFNLYPAIASVLGLASYTYFKKNFWMGGPIWNSLIVSLLPIMGLASTNRAFNFDLFLYDEKLKFILSFVFFSYFNFVLIGYLKDISADRETGYKTFPVIFGWNKTTLLGNLILILSIYFLYKSISSWTYTAIILFSMAIIVGILGQVYCSITSSKTEDNARIPIESTVRFFLLGNSSIIVSNKPQWLAVMVISYILFELILFLRPQRNQI